MAQRDEVHLPNLEPELPVAPNDPQQHRDVDHPQAPAGQEPRRPRRNQNAMAQMAEEWTMDLVRKCQDASAQLERLEWEIFYLVAENPDRFREHLERIIDDSEEKIAKTKRRLNSCKRRLRTALILIRRFPGNRAVERFQDLLRRANNSFLSGFEHLICLEAEMEIVRRLVA